MSKKAFTIFSLAAFLLATAGCSELVTESNNSIQQRVLDAWVRVNYPDKTGSKDSDGIYILEKSGASGRQVTDSVFVFVNYTARYLNGEIKDTNREDVAKQLGTYDPTTYYTHDIWLVDQASLTPGIYKVVKSLKKGERAVAAIPPALLESGTVSYYSLYYYTASDSDSENECVIYDIEILDIVDDITKYQADQMTAFRDKFYPGLDTLENGMYFKLLSGKGKTDTLESPTTFSTRYVGKLLDGFVFDTNIKDTARFYRIYNSSKEYTALDVKWYKEDDELLKNNSTVAGFTKAVRQMNKGDHAIVFFDSDHGYGASGSGSIPSYTPLFFDIYVEE